MENDPQFDLNSGRCHWREACRARANLRGEDKGRALRRPKFGGSMWLATLVVSSLLWATGCGQGTAPKTADSPGAASGQTPLESVIALWTGGNQDEAAEAFLKLDFSQARLFSKGSVLSYSETEFAALSEAARGQVAKQMEADLASLKGLCRRVKELGDEARSKGDAAKASQCAQQLKQCGERLDQPNSLAILRLIAKAITKLGTP
jgi:hypothetical protein